MINGLKKSYLNLGFERPTNYNRGPSPTSGQKLNKELGERTQAAKFMRARGFDSNVLPLPSNSSNIGKPGIGTTAKMTSSVTKDTFKWNTPKYDI